MSCWCLVLEEACFGCHKGQSNCQTQGAGKDKQGKGSFGLSLWKALYRRTELGSAKKSVLFSMCKQSMRERQQKSQICTGLKNKTPTLGQFCLLSSRIHRQRICRRGNMLTILQYCCSLVFSETITSVPPSLLLLKTSERAYRTLLEEAPLFSGICEWKYFTSCHMAEEEHCINQSLFHVIWKLPTQKTFKFPLTWFLPYVTRTRISRRKIIFTLFPQLLVHSAILI